MESISIQVSLKAGILLGIILIVSAAPTPADNGITAKSMDFLESFGYLQKPDPRAGKLLSQEDVTKAVKRMQEFAGLTPTGVIDGKTAKLISTPRCGMADVGRADSAKRKRRYNVQGSKWNKLRLSWRIKNYGNDGLAKAKVQSVFRNALNKWSSVTNLEFVEISSGEPDIWFRFARGAHGDPYPFRIPYSTVLAHAFYPFDSRSPLAGDVHFNDDKYFSIESTGGTDLLWVTVHELGHSIGLDHSNVEGSIMYPYYQGYQGSDFDLTPDDIRGVQALYGEKSITTPKIPEVTVKPYDPRCFSKMGAVFLANDKRTYVLNTDKLYILKKTLGIEKGPVPVSQLFKGVESVDAAFKRQSDRNTVIFSGKSYYVFRDDSEYLSGPTPISEGFVGFSQEFGDIDGAFVWPGNNLLYIFKGSDYWRVYQHGAIYRVARGYPKKISSAWGGVPDNIDAVTTWANGVSYFFKGTQYYRLNENLKLEPGYPKEITPAWVRSGSCASSAKVVNGGVVEGGQQNSASKSVMQATLATLMMSLAVSVLTLSS